MCAKWTTNDYANFARVRNERVPSVYQASLHLQAAVGITPGMKIIGEAPVLLWEMPEPPRETPKEMFASLKTRLGLVNPKSADAGMKECVDEEVGADRSHNSEIGGKSSKIADEHLDPGRHIGTGEAVETEETALRSGSPLQDHQLDSRKRRKRISSSLDNRDFNGVKRPKIIIDLTDSPGDNAALTQKRSSLQTTLRESKHPHAESKTAPRPASPPPLWMQPSRMVNSRHIPAYWIPNLSKSINKWLGNPSTQSSQVHLSHLELRSMPESYNNNGPPVFLSIRGKDYAKVKLSRLVLPPSAQQALTSTQSLDWLVVQITMKEKRSDSGSGGNGDEHLIPMRPGQFPYWLLTFPQQAITESSNAVEHLPVSASPLPPRPPLRPQTESERGRTSESMKRTAEMQQSHIMRLLLGKTARAPLIHGRGGNPKFAQAFIEACAAGKGVVEMRSWDPTMSSMLA